MCIYNSLNIVKGEIIVGLNNCGLLIAGVGYMCVNYWGTFSKLTFFYQFLHVHIIKIIFIIYTCESVLLSKSINGSSPKSLISVSGGEFDDPSSPFIIASIIPTSL